MNVFSQNEHERSEHEKRQKARNAEILKSRIATAIRLEADLVDYLRSNFPNASLRRAEEVLTLARADKMNLVITVMDGLYSLEYPGATDAMAQHRKNFGCFVLEKEMTAKVADWLNGKP